MNFDLRDGYSNEITVFFLHTGKIVFLISNI